METGTRERRGFGHENFSGAQLGDRRRTNRLIKITDRMVEHPGGTLPDKMRSPKELKALYRLVDNDAVTHEKVLEPHYARTRQRMEEQKGAVLQIQDTTELDYTGKESLTDLGQIGKGNRRGYLCHNTLAVNAASGEVLGLARQILHCRDEVPPDESRAQSRQRESRESRLWLRSSEAIGAAPPGALWVDVCDRGADTFEYLAYKHQANQHYLVRSKHNRTAEVAGSGEDHQAKLHTYARCLPEMGRRSVDVPARPGQRARVATMAVAWSAATLLPPKRPRGEHDETPLPAWVIRTWEVDPPEGVAPLEWILLTNVDVTCLADAKERMIWYCRRWIVEEYHKGLKTGCGIENPQFTTEERLQPVIAVLSVVALLLLNLRDASRDPTAKVRPARDRVPTDYIVVLSGWRFGFPRTDLTVHEFYYALARLGGHQNRKHDHPPGWIVLWRGWTKLESMVEGARVVGAL